MLAQLNATPTVIEGHTLVLTKPEDAFGSGRMARDVAVSRETDRRGNINLAKRIANEALKTVHVFLFCNLFHDLRSERVIIKQYYWYFQNQEELVCKIVECICVTYIWSSIL